MFIGALIGDIDLFLLTDPLSLKDLSLRKLKSENEIATVRYSNINFNKKVI